MQTTAQYHKRHPCLQLCSPSFFHQLPFCSFLKKSDFIIWLSLLKIANVFFFSLKIKSKFLRTVYTGPHNDGLAFLPRSTFCHLQPLPYVPATGNYFISSACCISSHFHVFTNGSHLSETLFPTFYHINCNLLLGLKYYFFQKHLP